MIPIDTIEAEIENLKQQSRDFTKQGEIEKATRIFNLAWDLENGFSRMRQEPRYIATKVRRLKQYQMRRL